MVLNNTYPKLFVARATLVSFAAKQVDVLIFAKLFQIIQILLILKMTDDDASTTFGLTLYTSSIFVYL